MSSGRASLDAATAIALIPAPEREVSELFWDIGAWHRIWRRIDEVTVLYDDHVHQEFAMGVQRDGRREDVRTIRYRRDDGNIDFFTPVPPPTMVTHRGSWRFSPVLGMPGLCNASAHREYRLIQRPGEDDTAYRLRRKAYRENFSRRLQAILDSFVSHFGAQAPAGAPQ